MGAAVHFQKLSMSWGSSNSSRYKDCEQIQVLGAITTTAAFVADAVRVCVQEANSGRGKVWKDVKESQEI